LHAAGEGFDHRKDAAQFLGFADRHGAGTSGFAADIEDFRALLHEFECVATAFSGSRKRPPSEKESGVTFTMPTTSAGRGKAK